MTPRSTGTAKGGDPSALSATERYLSPTSVEAAHAAALTRWPADPLVLLANGNQAYAAGRLREAIRRYQSLLAIEPGHVAGRNNLANALLDSGCPQAALAEARRASALLDAGSPLAAAVADTLAKAIAAKLGASTCRAE